MYQQQQQQHQQQQPRSFQQPPPPQQQQYRPAGGGDDEEEDADNEGGDGLSELPQRAGYYESGAGKRGISRKSIMREVETDMRGRNISGSSNRNGGGADDYEDSESGNPQAEAARQKPVVPPSGANIGQTRAKSGVDRDGFEVRRAPAPAPPPPRQQQAYGGAGSDEEGGDDGDVIGPNPGFAGAPALPRNSSRPGRSSMPPSSSASSGGAGAVPSTGAGSKFPLEVKVMPSQRAKLEQIRKERQSLGGGNSGARPPTGGGDYDGGSDEDAAAAAEGGYGAPPASSKSRQSLAPQAAPKPAANSRKSLAPAPPQLMRQGSAQSLTSGGGGSNSSGGFAGAGSSPDAPSSSSSSSSSSSASDYYGHQQQQQQQQQYLPPRPPSASPPPQYGGNNNGLTSSPPAPSAGLYGPVGSGYDADAGQKIKVVVRKRPMNGKERGGNARGDERCADVVQIMSRRALAVHEHRQKVDLTPYTDSHEFTFDEVFGEDCGTAEVYRHTAAPLIGAIFAGANATCFAYGQTGSGKTYTMMGNVKDLASQDASDVAANAANTPGLYVLAARDIFHTLNSRRDITRGGASGGQAEMVVVVSYFEIYGGKLFDLLAGRAEIKAMADGADKVQLKGLSERVVDSVPALLACIDTGNRARSVGSTGANEDSSRSHAVLSITLGEMRPVLIDRRGGTEMSLLIDPATKRAISKGKISFVDLAGSERGADTTASDRQRRQEGAEINKSLLALKECIRSLYQNAGHNPFRGSKLTQVLKDSFIGDSRTVMIATISPTAANCEHSLNTLRYAYRVKEIRQESGAGGGAASAADEMPHGNMAPLSRDAFLAFSGAGAGGGGGVGRPSSAAHMLKGGSNNNNRSSPTNYPSKGAGARGGASVDGDDDEDDDYDNDAGTNASARPSRSPSPETTAAAANSAAAAARPSVMPSSRAPAAAGGAGASGLAMPRPSRPPAAGSSSGAAASAAATGAKKAAGGVAPRTSVQASGSSGRVTPTGDVSGGAPGGSTGRESGIPKPQPGAAAGGSGAALARAASAPRLTSAHGRTAAAADGSAAGGPRPSGIPSAAARKSMAPFGGAGGGGPSIAVFVKPPPHSLASVSGVGADAAAAGGSRPASAPQAGGGFKAGAAVAESDEEDDVSEGEQASRRRITGSDSQVREVRARYDQKLQQQTSADSDAAVEASAPSSTSSSFIAAFRSGSHGSDGVVAVATPPRPTPDVSGNSGKRPDPHVVHTSLSALTSPQRPAAGGMMSPPGAKPSVAVSSGGSNSSGEGGGGVVTLQPAPSPGRSRAPLTPTKSPIATSFGRAAPGPAAAGAAAGGGSATGEAAKTPLRQIFASASGSAAGAGASRSAVRQPPGSSSSAVGSEAGNFKSPLNAWDDEDADRSDDVIRGRGGRAAGDVIYEGDEDDEELASAAGRTGEDDRRRSGAAGLPSSPSKGLGGSSGSGTGPRRQIPFSGSGTFSSAAGSTSVPSANTIAAHMRMGGSMGGDAASTTLMLASDPDPQVQRQLAKEARLRAARQAVAGQPLNDAERGLVRLHAEQLDELGRFLARQQAALSAIRSRGDMAGYAKQLEENLGNACNGLDGLMTVLLQYKRAYGEEVGWKDDSDLNNSGHLPVRSLLPASREDDADNDGGYGGPIVEEADGQWHGQQQQQQQHYAGPGNYPSLNDPSCSGSGEIVEEEDELGEESAERPVSLVAPPHYSNAASDGGGSSGEEGSGGSPGLVYGGPPAAAGGGAWRR